MRPVGTPGGDSSGLVEQPGDDEREAEDENGDTQQQRRAELRVEPYGPRKPGRDRLRFRLDTLSRDTGRTDADRRGDESRWSTGFDDPPGVVRGGPKHTSV